MSSYSRQQLEEWLKTIDVEAMKVLDVGGSQLPVKGRTKSWFVGDYKILDLADPHENKKNQDVICDLNESISSNLAVQHFSIDENRVDIIFLLEVMEYIWDPRAALQNCSFMLKKGGILYLSTHFIYPVHNPVSDDCLRYTKRGIIKLLTEVGFKIEQIIPRKVKNENLMNFFRSQNMRPAKNLCEEQHNEVGYLIKAKKTGL